MHGLNKDIIFPLQIFALSNNVLYNFPEQGVVPVLYVIYAQDKADSLEKRLSVRPAHLARLQLLHDEGRLLTAGPMPAVDSNDPGAAGFTGSTISFTTLLFYSTYGALYLSEGFNPRIESLMTAFYFSIETMSTVGYGDIVPVSESARLFTISVIISGITVFATSMTSIFGPLIRGGFNKLVKGNNHTMHRKDHFIVCGHSILAINTILQLNQRGQNVTVISNLPEDDIKQLEQRLGDNADVIPGDSNDSSVLKKAGIDRCRAILALSDNDADNAFVVLSAKDMSSDVKTVLAVSDSKNLNKIKMVHPDIILSPQLFGSEILARVLNGEEINNDMLVSMLLNSGHGIFSDNDEQETKADSKESAQK